MLGFFEVRSVLLKNYDYLLSPDSEELDELGPDLILGGEGGRGGETVHDCITRLARAMVWVVVWGLWFVGFRGFGGGVGED